MSHGLMQFVRTPKVAARGKTKSFCSEDRKATGQEVGCTSRSKAERNMMNGRSLFI